MKESDEHHKEIQNALTTQNTSLEDVTSLQETKLSEQLQAINTWSAKHNQLVEEVHVRVSKFLSDELKEDLPTGLSMEFPILPFIINAQVTVLRSCRVCL